MLVNFTMETSLNSVALASVMSRFPAGVADSTRACNEMLPVIIVGVVGKVFPWRLMLLLITVIPALVPTPRHAPLFILEFILLFGRPFHINCGVVHVFIRGVVSDRHPLLEP